MQNEEKYQTLTGNPVIKHEVLRSFITGPKKDDVIFFRMESPSQLENEYEFGPVLGEGTFGVVYRGVQKKDGTHCAIKKILRERTYSASERSRLDREISILRSVRHPGIIQLLAVAESPTILFLITELCEGHTLDKCLDKLPAHTGLEEYVVVEIVRQVTSALAYLHNRGIVHRDLKAGNIMFLNEVELDFRPLEPDILITPQPTSSKKHPKGRENLSQPDDLHNDVRAPKSAGPVNTKALHTKGVKASSANAVRDGIHPNKSSQPHISNHPNHSTTILAQGPAKPQRQRKQPSAPLITKIIDFGLAIEVRKNEESLDSQCGTLLYMAPEVISGRSYTRQCDVWSLGILIYQLLTRRFPFTAHSEEQLLEEIRSFNPGKVIDPLTCVSHLARNCLSNALHTDPAYRYSAAELLLDPWVAQDERAGNTVDGSANVCDGNLSQTLEALTHSQFVASTSKSLHSEPQPTKKENSITSLPPPGRVGTPSGTHSTTNVLQLMKQYHKELTEHKLQ